MYVFRITVALVPALALNLFLPFRFVKGRYLAPLAFLIGFLLTSGFSVCHVFLHIILSSKLRTLLNTVMSCNRYVLSLITCNRSRHLLI